MTLGSPPLPHHMTKCIVHNMPVSEAIEYTGAKGSRQGLYQRIARWRNSLAPPNLAQLQAIEEGGMEYSHNQGNKEMRGRHGYGAQATVEQVNTCKLSYPNNRKLSATSLQ